MSDSAVINNYANSMFRYEYLHESWLSSCERYLHYVFGGSGTHGRTVVDYAFGRGNWAIAFARCGAERVIAVDASEDNCRKLRVYCEENGITNIEVVWGNLEECDLDIGCDILWFYGILPMLPNADVFLEKILSSVRADGQVLSYTYNAASLREWMVSTARACVVFADEGDFRAHSLWFTPAARLRARDDLVAPHVNWDNASAFVGRFARLGWHLAAQLEDFAPWLHGVDSGEFNPYVVKFVRKESGLPVVSQEDNPADLAILSTFGELVTQRLPQDLRVSFAVGLFNTHFQHLTRVVTGGEKYKTNEKVAWEDFKYLVYAATTLSVTDQDFGPDMAEVWAAAMCSLKGSPRKAQSETLDGSLILEMLANTTIRI
jgi:SAM-dependent methyltransferase